MNTVKGIFGYGRKTISWIIQSIRFVFYVFGELVFTVVTGGLYLISRLFEQIQIVSFFQHLNKTNVVDEVLKISKKEAIKQLVLSTFIPFYVSFWFYKANRSLLEGLATYGITKKDYGKLLAILACLPLVGPIIVMACIQKNSVVLLKAHPYGKIYTGRLRNQLAIPGKIIISLLTGGLFYILTWMFSIVRRVMMVSSSLPLMTSRAKAKWHFIGMLVVPFYAAFWYGWYEFKLSAILLEKKIPNKNYSWFYAILLLLFAPVISVMIVVTSHFGLSILIGYVVYIVASIIVAAMFDRKLHQHYEQILPELELGIFLREDRPAHFIRKLTPRKMVIGAFSYVWLTMMVFIVLLPVLWMISATFTSGTQLSQVPIIPNPAAWTLENFTDPQKGLFTYISSTSETVPDYVRAFLTTLSIASLTMVLVVIFSSLVGFSFSRYKFKGKKQVLLSMMALQMFPSFMGMLALFMFFRQFGLLNNPVALSLIYVAGSIPYNTFIVRGFMRNIPKSLDEAAFIDGASNLQTLFRIIIPLAVPIMGFIAVNAFMGPWLDYILPSVIMPSRDTVAVWLFRYMDPMAATYSPIRFMSGALVIAIPIMIVQAFMQRYLVYGLTSGAEKG